MKKLKRKIKFPKQNRVDAIYTNGIWSQWCCKCKSRHIWHFRVVRDKNPVDDYVVITILRDFLAEKLRKYYERSEKGYD